MMPKYKRPKRRSRPPVTYTHAVDESGHVVCVEGSDGSRVFMAAAEYARAEEHEGIAAFMERLLPSRG